MSTSNVELVKSLIAPSSVNLAALFRDDERWAQVVAFYEPRVHPDFESGFVRAGERTSYRGIDGFRQTWLDWVEPWESYRAELEAFEEYGDNVVVLVNDYGSKPDMTAEVRLRGAAVWTVREGRLARAFFYVDRADALKDGRGAILDGE